MTSTGRTTEEVDNYIKELRMDALQLAAASLAGCDLFLTNDKQLKQFGEIKCITVGELK